MPLVPFVCPHCGKECSRFRSLSQLREGVLCPHCGKVAQAKGVAVPAAAGQTGGKPAS